MQVLSRLRSRGRIIPLQREDYVWNDSAYRRLPSLQSQRRVNCVQIVYFPLFALLYDLCLREYFRPMTNPYLFIFIGYKYN